MVDELEKILKNVKDCRDKGLQYTEEGDYKKAIKELVKAGDYQTQAIEYILHKERLTLHKKRLTQYPPKMFA